MVQSGVSPIGSDNVASQDDTILAVEMSSADGPEEAEDFPSKFFNTSAIVCDHSYLPICFIGLVDNTLVCVSGFVVWQILRKLSCDVQRASLVTDIVSASLDQS